MSLNDKKICFIGAGNMANAIVGGLVSQGLDADNITATAPEQSHLSTIAERWGIHTTTDNQAAAASADVIVLSVKPQVLKAVCEGLQGSLSHQPLIISIAAGIEMASIQAWLGASLPIVRCMPNTPSQMQMGASGLIANNFVSAEQKQVAEALFTAIGLVDWVAEEALMHAVTALSGSGPAYIFMLIEAMEAAAVKQGIESETARKLAAQTVAGAAAMVLGNDIAPAQLKRNVMSPGGTTERAIQVFEERGLMTIVDEAMQAAADRSVSLSAELTEAD